MAYRLLIFLMLVLLLSVAVGCSKKAAKTNTVKPVLEWTFNDIACTFKHTSTPSALDITPFQLNVTDQHSKPVSGLNVDIDLSMPSMTMPKNVVACKEISPGVYTGTGRYTMNGDWRMNVIIKRQGTIINTHALDITVR